MKDELKGQKDVLNVDNDSIDEEEDEDYVPKNESDDEGFVGEGENENNESLDVPGCRLDNVKRKAVDDAFDSLFGKSSSIKHDEFQELAVHSVKKKKMKRARKMKRALDKKRRVLTDLFGSSQAVKLLSTSSFVTNNSGANYSEEKNRTTRRIRHSGSNLPTLERKTIIEVKKFAGQQIEIKKIVKVETDMGKKSDVEMVTDINSSSNTHSSKPLCKSNNTPITEKRSNPIGIDSVLSKLSKSENISTLVKSNADWDLFKDKTGLENELEKNAQGKNAYLVKKDFLQRVDERKFEHEREERDRKRRARVTSNGV